MEKIEKLIFKYPIILILILSIPAIWALFVKGYYGASDDLHIAWLFELDRTIKMGQVPPRFVPDLSFGFGYPLFNFVFPLPFYLAELIHLLGFSLVDSIKAIFLLSIPLSGIFMYFLLKEFTNKTLSLIGAILYIYTPYRSVDIYIRGAIGEVVSFIFLPLIILAILKLKTIQKLRWIGIGALALSSLVLSHNITAYMFLPFICLFFFLQFFSSLKKWAFFTKSILMFLLALFISIYFWLPAVVESSLMKYDTVFNFFDHFPTIKQLFTPYWGYGGSVPGNGDGMSFFLGFAGIFVLIFALIIVLRGWKDFNLNKKLLVSWSIFGILISLVLMNYRSIPLWNSIPLLPYFQFPWRFLILTTFFIPLLLVVFDDIKFKKYLYLVLLIAILPTLFYFRPQDFLGREDNYYINRYIPYPSASLEYLKTQEEYLRLPNKTMIRPDKNYPVIFPADGIKNIYKSNDLQISFDFESEKGASISMNKYNFPGWVAQIDGKQVQIDSGAPFGQVSIFVPEGSHKVEIKFAETTFRKYLNFASLITFLVSLTLVLI